MSPLVARSASVAALASAVLLFLAVGCAQQDSVAKSLGEDRAPISTDIPITFERFFHGTLFHTALGEYHAYVTFKEKYKNKSARDTATKEIELYLRGRGTEPINPPFGDLSNREFWALVLAKLKGLNFRIFRTEAKDAREKKIQVMLDEIEHGLAEQPETDAHTVHPRILIPGQQVIQAPSRNRE